MCDISLFCMIPYEKAIIFRIVRLIIAVIQGIRNEACSRRGSQRGLELCLQQKSASDASDSADLVTYSSFPRAHRFFSHITDNCWIL